MKKLTKLEVDKENAFKSPSEELVEVISPMLVDEELFLPDDIKNYKYKIAAGTMKSEDWLLAVEKATTKVEQK